MRISRLNGFSLDDHNPPQMCNAGSHSFAFRAGAGERHSMQKPAVFPAFSHDFAQEPTAFLSYLGRARRCKSLIRPRASQVGSLV
jgi:hypothetical protein